MTGVEFQRRLDDSPCFPAFTGVGGNRGRPWLSALPVMRQAAPVDEPPGGRDRQFRDRCGSDYQAESVAAVTLELRASKSLAAFANLEVLLWRSKSGTMALSSPREVEGLSVDIFRDRERDLSYSPNGSPWALWRTGWNT